MKHYSYAKTTALMCSAAFIMISLTSNAAFSAPTVTGTKGCIMGVGGTATKEKWDGSGSDGNGVTQHAQCGGGWGGGATRDPKNDWEAGNFVSADEVNNALREVERIINEKTSGDGGAKDREQDGRLDGHDTKITNVTNTVNNQGDRITKNEGDITNINNTLTDHGDRITKNEGDISNINNTLTDHGDRITKNEGDIIDIKGDITDIKGDITTINNTLDNHETRITKNEGDIAELQDSAVKYDKDSSGNKTGNVTLDAGTGQAVGLGNVAAGKTGNDAVNVDQLNGALAGLGGGAKVEADGTVTQPTYNVGGANYNNVGDALKAQGDLSVQYVADENGKPTNKIILTGNGDGGAVSIGNVKAAEADHEAVNYGQVKDNISYDRNPDGSRSNVVTMKGGSNGSVAIRNVSDGVNDSDAATYRQVKQSYKDSKDYTDQQVNNLRDSSNEKFSALNGELAEVRKESRAGIASAMAAAGLRYDDRAGKGSIAMGMGGFKNATSIAAGVGYTSEDGNWRLNSAIAHSFSGSATSWNAGVSWTFN